MGVDSPGGVSFTANYPGSACGLSLPRRELDFILLECARKQITVEIREGFHVRGLILEDGVVRGVMGGTREGETEAQRGRIVVGADGRNSVVARELGLFRWHASHRKVALGLHYEGVRPGGEGAEIHIGGSLYGILNHQQNGCVNVNLVADCDGLERWKGRLDAWFGVLLADLPLLGERLRCAKPLERVQALGPLAHYATQVSADGALLAGDAAGFYDPFTGEGMYMALESSRLAAETVERALEERCYSRRLLRQYDRARRASLESRYRLEGLIQRIIGCGAAADFAARRLRQSDRLANVLLEVLGGLRRPAELMLTTGGLSGLWRARCG
jgi:flavin-dependent dehydrogenase